MADEPTTTAIPPAAAAPVPPAAPPGQQTLPGTPAPAAAAPAAAAPAAPAAPARTGKPQGKQIRIPENQFKDRVQREARSVAKRELGVDLPEAKRLIAEAKAKAAGAPAPAAAPAAAPSNGKEAAKLAQENAKLRQEMQQLQQKVTHGDRKAQKQIERLKDRNLETQLAFKAAAAGVKETDFALHLYQKAINAAVAGKTELPKPETFFPALRATHPFLFQDQAPPPAVTVPVTTAPPESRAPGEATPTPASPGTGSPAMNVEALDAKGNRIVNDQDFARHTAQNYGWRPGM